MAMPSPTNVRTIAVLGTGTMGSAMARNLAARAFIVRAWNRTGAKAAALRESGVTVVDSPADAVSDADVIITMLTDGEAVLSTMQSAVAGLRPGVVWAQMSTVGTQAVTSLDEFATQHGITFIDAPVQGSRQPAEQGQLVVIAAGPPEARPVIEPVFNALGRRTVWVCDDGAGGAASRLKLALNHYAFCLTHAIADSLAMAKAVNVDPRLVLDVVSGGPMDNGYFQVKGESILKGEFTPNFTIKNAVKDAQLIRDAAQRAGLHADLADASLHRFERALAAGHGDKDMAASFLAA